MAATNVTEAVAQTMDSEAKRHHAAGVLFAALHGPSKTPGALIHVEPHHEGNEPTGDLLLRVYGFPGEWRLHLEAVPEEPRF